MIKNRSSKIGLCVLSLWFMHLGAANAQNAPTIDTTFKIVASSTTECIWNARHIWCREGQTKAWNLLPNPNASKYVGDALFDEGRLVVMADGSIYTLSDSVAWQQIASVPEQLDAKHLALVQKGLVVTGATRGGKADLTKVPNVAIDIHGYALLPAFAILKADRHWILEKLGEEVGSITEVCSSENGVIALTQFGAFQRNFLDSRWRVVNSPTSRKQQNAPITASCGEGVVVIGYLDGTILRQTSKRNWELVPQSTFHHCHLKRITILDSGNGLALCDSSVWRTADLGDTWKRRTDFGTSVIDFYIDSTPTVHVLTNDGVIAQPLTK